MHTASKTLIQKIDIHSLPQEYAKLVHRISLGEEIYINKVLEALIIKNDPQSKFLVMIVCEKILKRLKKIDSSEIVVCRLIHLAKHYASDYIQTAVLEAFHEYHALYKVLMPLKMSMLFSGVRGTFSIKIAEKVIREEAEGDDPITGLLTLRHAISLLMRQGMKVSKSMQVALDKATNFSRSASEISLDIQEQENPILIQSGWESHENHSYGHSIYFVIYRNQIIRCNRGPNYNLPNERPGLEVFTFDPSKATPEIVSKLLNRKAGYVTSENLIKDLSMQANGYFPQKRQTVGNCTWASAKSAIYGLMLLESYYDASPEVQIDAKRSQILFQLARTRFKRFTYSIKSSALQSIKLIKPHLLGSKTLFANLEKKQKRFTERIIKRERERAKLSELATNSG